MSIPAPTLKEIATSEGRACASIFMPVYHGGREARQNPIRLKNLVRDVERDWPGDEAALRPLHDCIDDESFWADRDAGLALLLDENAFHVIDLPTEPPEVATVDKRFRVRPLLQAGAERSPFCVVALSLSSCRLLACDGARVRSIAIDAPEGIDAVSGEGEPTLQHHVHTSRAAARRGVPQYHGQGEPDDAREADVDRYLRRVADAVADADRPTDGPLILAGVEWVCDAFRKIANDPTIEEEIVSGAVDHLSDDEVADQAREIHSRRLAEQRRIAIEGIEAAVGAGQGVRGVRDALAAALDGRVDTLAVPQGLVAAGRFDEGARQIHVGDEHGDDDLIDHACRETIAMGGTVVETDAVDDVIARLRF